MGTITHNLQGMNANRQLNITTGRKADAAEKLSSGYRINRAADDASGLAISEKMRKQIRGLSQGVDNTKDGISLCQVADSALSDVHDMLHRITELSIQAANGTMSELERKDIQGEITHLISEVSRIGETTTFNGIHIFDIAGKTKEEVVDMELIKSPSAANGYMSEAYEDGGNFYYAASMDFSALNTANIAKLFDKSFSFTCSQSCPETFEFKFVNGGGSKFVNPGSANQRVPHYYEIDIQGMTDGSQIANALFDFVYKNPASASGGLSGNEVKVSHSNILVKTGNDKLVIRAVSPSFSSAADAIASAENQYKGSQYGQTDFAEVTGSTETRITNILPIQYGADEGDMMELEVERMNAFLIGISDINVTTVKGCNQALGKTKNALEAINRQRSKIGSQQNRLEHTIANEDNIVENTAASESRIRDTDMAEVMVMHSMVNILQQAGQSVLAQANQSNQGVINLLR